MIVHIYLTLLPGLFLLLCLFVSMGSLICLSCSHESSCVVAPCPISGPHSCSHDTLGLTQVAGRVGTEIVPGIRCNLRMVKLSNRVESSRKEPQSSWTGPSRTAHVDYRTRLQHHTVTHLHLFTKTDLCAHVCTCTLTHTHTCTAASPPQLKYRQNISLLRRHHAQLGPTFSTFYLHKQGPRPLHVSRRLAHK